ncbi:MAG: hypothetical protein PHW95_02235 [Patescibacteria group bacterium]|nr:hypothetical protein [Patescibacteria group bacterium]
MATGVVGIMAANDYWTCSETAETANSLDPNAVVNPASFKTYNGDISKTKYFDVYTKSTAQCVKGTGKVAIADKCMKDVCTGGSCQPTAVSSCTAQDTNCRLQESFILDSANFSSSFTKYWMPTGATAKKMINSWKYNCPNGCNDGACSNSNLSNAFDETVDVYMSETPSNILALSNPYGPHQADLTLVGTSATDPSFTVTSHVSFDSAKDLQWVLGNVQCSNLPAGFICPTISKYSNAPFLSNNLYDENLGDEFVAVKSGGQEQYRMSWHITGTATPQIKPVLLSRFHIRPWIGNKTGWFLKIRNSQAYQPTADPYGDFSPLVLDKLAQLFSNMSNGQLKMSYLIKEVYYPLNSTSIESSDLQKNILQSLGADGSNYRQYFDWTIFSYYKSTLDSLSNPTIWLTGAQGVSPSPACLYCGPGATIHNLQTTTGLIMHELGHGIGLSNAYAELNAYCPDSIGSSEVKYEHIFVNCAPDILRGRFLGPFYQSMGPYLGSNWYDPLERASLGWLKSGQITMVTSSGVYDLYSDNDDFTSDINKPLILQVLVTSPNNNRWNGSNYILDFDKTFTDFVYLIAPNKKTVVEAPSWFNGGDDYIGNGIRLSAGELTGRVANQVAGEQWFYSYNNNLGSDPNNLFVSSYRHTIPVDGETHLVWPGTDIKIKLLERTGSHARVQITYQ